jgi:hypothetical protein
MAENMHGFEVLVGPYAVAHLRLTQALEGAMNEAKAVGDPEEKLAKRLNIYLADTLESPNAAPPGGLTLTYRALTAEHEAARKVKQGGDVLVCLGNPPYDRQTIVEGDTTTQRKGGWVRFGDQVKGAAKQEEQRERPIFKDFTDPASNAGAGVHVKMLYNDYVYFWRWALWRLFEQQTCGGIVTFITASSYLAGPGFIGVREVMRRTFDEIWIIDLGGDNFGTRKTPNVFNIQTPVAIAIGVRAPEPRAETPAKVRYAKIEGATREVKLTKLEAISNFDGLVWRDCAEAWEKPFLPASGGDYFAWPSFESLFPFSFSGVQTGRNWVIGETVDVLDRRLELFLAKGKLTTDFGESRDTKISSEKRNLDGGSLNPLVNWTHKSDAQQPTTYSLRAYDRHRAFLDPRLCDWPRPDALRGLSVKQVFFGSLHTEALASGQALAATHAFPDLNFFHGRGGRISPLYRDAAGTEPNVTAGLLAALGKEHGFTPSAEDLAAYVYALLGGQSYTKRFWNELETPGPRVPMTKDGAIFADAVKLGRKLIWLHTYAARFQDATQGDEVPIGKATTIKGVSSVPAKYPAEYAYDPAKCEITVGDGRFGPVAPEVWGFEVSGLKVVQSWLGYRMKKRSGKKSSPLDEIRPECWTARMSDEFLELLWVLEATLAMEADLATVLDKAVCGPCFAASDLPQPTAAERRAPGATSTAGDLLALMEDDDAADDDDEDGDDD